MGLRELLNDVAVVLGLVGLPLSILFHFRPRSSFRVSWVRRNSQIVDDRRNDVESLKVTYDDASVDHLAITRVAIWNSGRSAVEKSFVDRDDPFRLTAIEPAKILRAQLVGSTNPCEGDTQGLVVNNGTILVEFNFWNLGEGVVVDVVHTGIGSGAIVLLGRMKGISAYRRHPNVSRYIIILSLLIEIMLLPIVYMASYSLENQTVLEEPIKSTVIVLLAIGVVLNVLLIVVTLMRRLPSAIDSNFAGPLPGESAPIDVWMRAWRSR